MKRQRLSSNDNGDHLDGKGYSLEKELTIVDIEHVRDIKGSINEHLQINKKLLRKNIIT